MILILGDNIPSWLKYIWGQFAAINILKTESKFLAYSNYHDLNPQDDKKLIIEYALKQRYPSSLFIPRREFFKTDDYVWIKPHLPIYRNTMEEGGTDYDIFYNTFVHLSRKEEWENEKKGLFIHGYSSNHPRKDKRIWKIPVVNYLFNELESKIKAKNPQVSFGVADTPVIEFSHDVDYLRKTAQLRIKQCSFNFYNFIRLLLRLRFKDSMDKLGNIPRFAFLNREYWHFKEWAEIEVQFNIKAVYYFFADSKTKAPFNLKKWLIEPSYDILTNQRLIDECKKIIACGNKIGLHGSYFSASNPELFTKEKLNLENAIGSNVIKSRQHWLNYYESKTPYIYQDSGIKEDSTIGFNDISGFRAGVASRYNPYDHQNEIPFNFKEIPLVVMDSHLYDYCVVPLSDNLKWLFDSIDNVKKFMISIDWHQHGISPDYDWVYAYKNIADRIRNN